MDIVGATGPSYAMLAAIPADCGATFRVAVSDASGSNTTLSIPATLTVTTAPGGPVIVTNPVRARLQPGEKATFSVTAQSATPMTYQWQQATLTTNYVDISGATAASFTIPAVKLADHRTLFRCIVTNAAGSASSAGEMVLVTSTAPASKNASAPPSPGN